MVNLIDDVSILRLPLLKSHINRIPKSFQRMPIDLKNDSSLQYQVVVSIRRPVFVFLRGTDCKGIKRIVHQNVKMMICISFFCPTAFWVQNIYTNDVRFKDVFKRDISARVHQWESASQSLISEPSFNVRISSGNFPLANFPDPGRREIYF